MIERHEAGAFYAQHADEEDLLDRAQPALSMKMRLRPYFPLAFFENTTLFTISDGGQIVAIAECFPHENIEGRLNLAYVTVDENFRARGFASALVGNIVDFMQAHGYQELDSSYYTESGSAYLKHVLRRIGKHGVHLLESSKPYRGAHKTRTIA